MKKGFWLFVLLMDLIAPQLVAAADTAAVVDAPAAPVPPDMITLKDGGIIYGEVVEMADGVV